MKGLRIADLQEGQIYRCQLSGYDMLISRGMKQPPGPNGLINVPKSNEMFGKFFNKITGVYQYIDISDNQLVDPSVSERKGIATQQGVI